MKNLFLYGQDDFYCNVYRNDDRSHIDLDGNGIWFAVQKGKDTA